MAVTYDLATDRGKVRLLAGDSAGGIFTDAEIDAFLSLESNEVWCAAAAALEAIASQEARLASVQETLNYKKDTTEIAKGLLEAAARYRAHVEADPSYGAAEIGQTPFIVVDIILNRLERDD